ncbi:putative tubulin--tyrosine ligase [Escovopsis weberi]|uniref:Putative tubulin--tyrosine ligase n=1 Tax=Escovopsis weberi TaxID=150374 RepID=A0A0M8N8W6_ESCWE|nr:putative tubulin--tyrosine ligase [Escovopsis weberi]
MHILITNDDGPPCPTSSPYIHCLVRHLQKAGHAVSVCLPHTQRSWISKAHMIGQMLKPTYYRPAANSFGEDSEGSIHPTPSPSGDVEEWILVDGTPASAVQIGLNHFFQDRGPVDLVVSGPNYGRNTTALFALSSGTLGGALEAAVCGRRAVALSFAFFTRNHDPVIIEGACRHSVRVIEALCRQWPADGAADLYSVNVPLVEGVEAHRTVFTDILQNYWTDGGCFAAVDCESGEGAVEEQLIREGPGGEVEEPDRVAETRARGHTHKHFKWAPRFTDVYKSVDLAGPGTDGWWVKEGHTSVTPLKANFASCAGANAQKELELSVEAKDPELALRVGKKGTQEHPSQRIRAVVAYDDVYVQPLILSALKSELPDGVLDLVTDPSPPALDGASPTGKLDKILQILPYESIDFELAAERPGSCLVNSYMIRKALIRKHYLSATVDHWTAKNPGSVLGRHVKRSEAFEVDYAEFLDDALVEAFDLRESMERNAQAARDEDREWWILKPGMSDRGQGIRLFSTMEELQAIFDGWEEDSPDSDAEDDDEEAEAGEETKGGDYITTSHLRHFVVQPYIHPPLLVGAGPAHKFHVRTYVLCVGGLKVYVYRHMLALFAGKPYAAPWEAQDDAETFLTNTCIQGSPSENAGQGQGQGGGSSLEGIFGQICDITGEVFEAAARAMPIHFQTMPNAFEVFGLDFLVDERGAAWLLEVNAFPDFKQTGGELRDVVEGFWRGVVRRAVVPFFGAEGGAEEDMEGAEGRDMVLVRDVDLGRR